MGTKFVAQQVQILLNQDGRIAQLVITGTVSLKKTQQQMGFQWTPEQADKDSLQALLEKGSAQVKAEEGME